MLEIAPSMKRMLPKLIGAILAMTGSAVMIGWILGIPSLTAVPLSTISLKFITATSFFFAGFMLYFLARFTESASEIAQIIVIMTANIILLIMGTLLVSFVFGINTGIEMLFVREPAGTAATVIPGQPSLGVMAGFVLFSVGGILTLTRGKRSYALIHDIGITLWFFGVLVLIGYAIHSPLLEFQIVPKSNPASLLAGFLFILTGIGCFFIGSP